MNQAWTPDAQQPGLFLVTLTLPGTTTYKAYRLGLPNGSSTPLYGGYPGYPGYPGSSVVKPPGTSQPTP